MTARRTYQVKEVAQIAGVSVRALHHYDEIGLLVPSGRSAAGYRLYSEADLLRLQQIVIGRELGLALEEIRRSLDDPNFDLKQALLSQRAQLSERVKRAESMIRAVDQALASITHENAGETMDKRALFDGFDPARYESEAEQRWGDTDAYRVSKERTQRYSQEDWQKLAQEQGAVYADAAAAMQAGHAPDAELSMDIAERARLVIDRWFYPCSRAHHSALADLYESDSRYAANIDKHGTGLTTFLAAAIRANARRS